MAVKDFIRAAALSLACASSITACAEATDLPAVCEEEQLGKEMAKIVAECEEVLARNNSSATCESRDEGFVCRDNKGRFCQVDDERVNTSIGSFDGNNVCDVDGNCQDFQDEDCKYAAMYNGAYLSRMMIEAIVNGQ